MKRVTVLAAGCGRTIVWVSRLIWAQAGYMDPMATRSRRWPTRWASRARRRGDAHIIRGRSGRELTWRDAPDWLEEVTSIQHTAGANADQINHRAYWFVKEYGGADVTFPDGYDAIFGALAGGYTQRLSQTVKHVAREPGRVTLGLANGGAERFDAVVVTVPLGALKRGDIRFAPVLPQDKADAIARLGMGTLDKVYLVFDRVFWDVNAEWILTPDNDLPPGQFNQWLNSSIDRLAHPSWWRSMARQSMEWRKKGAKPPPKARPPRNCRRIMLTPFLTPRA